VSRRLIEKIAVFALSLGCVFGVVLMVVFIKGLGFPLWPAAAVSAVVGVGAGVISFFMPTEELVDDPVDN
jgi:predicted phosphoribosyltransferase